jgi:hypothetical protein
MNKSFIAPTGYVELDNDCGLDVKSTRSREEVSKDDLAYYFQTYIIPKYALNNINVNNVASFMKDLEMNWTKIPSDLKPNILNIFVDSILANDSSFKTDLLAKLSPPEINVKSTFTENNKSEFGFPTDNSTLNIFIMFFALIAILYVLDKMSTGKTSSTFNFS